MQKRCEESSRKEDFSSLAREVRLAKKELAAFQTQVRQRYAQSKRIDKKYSLFRNRYILRTGEEPVMELMNKPYSDISFMMTKNEEEEKSEKKVEEEKNEKNEEEEKKIKGVNC